MDLVAEGYLLEEDVAEVVDLGGPEVRLLYGRRRGALIVLGGFGATEA